jgi:hypothetical protein
MKFRINLSMALLLTIAFAASLTFSSCKDDDDKKCCEGYTGKITDARADSLVRRCHFISRDSIEVWVKRYEAYKERLNRKPGYRTDKDTANANANNDEMKPGMDEMAAGFLKGGSVSYNSCIIKKILCDKNSIGLRVLYGIGSDNRIHIILVGIQPDYSNLYIDGEDCCDKSMNKTLGAGLTAPPPGDGTGGAEYGQMP